MLPCALGSLICLATLTFKIRQSARPLDFESNPHDYVYGIPPDNVWPAHYSPVAPDKMQQGTTSEMWDVQSHTAYIPQLSNLHTYPQRY